jgi:hypothetical protein
MLEAVVVAPRARRATRRVRPRAIRSRLRRRVRERRAPALRSRTASVRRKWLPLLGIPRGRRACRTASVGEELLRADREVVEVGEPERRCDEEAENSRNDDAGVQCGHARTEPDRDERDVRRMHVDAAEAYQERPDEADQQREQPEQWLQSALREPGRPRSAPRPRPSKEQLSRCLSAAPRRRALRGRRAAAASARGSGTQCRTQLRGC